MTHRVNTVIHWWGDGSKVGGVNQWWVNSFSRKSAGRNPGPIGGRGSKSQWMSTNRVKIPLVRTARGNSVAASLITNYGSQEHSIRNR